MPMYDNYGNNPFDFKTMGKELWGSLQSLDPNKKAEVEEYAKRVAEQQASFKAAQERNRLAKEQKKTNIFDEPLSPDRTDYEEGVYPRKVVATKTFPTTPSAMDRVKQTKMVSGKTIGESVGNSIATEDEIKNFYANKGAEPTETQSVATTEKEAPLSEPVQAEEVAPKANIFDSTTAPATTSTPRITSYDSRGEGKGTRANIFDDVRTPALEKVYSNYDLQERNAQDKRNIIDSMNKNVNRAIDEMGKLYDERVKMRNGSEEGGSWADWLNPLGALQGIGEVFYGKTVYNPETQAYETRPPQNWHDLAQNLFLNLSRAGSGLRFSTSSNGRGGRSFSMGYDSSLPTSILKMQLENSKAPFADWEEFRREANDPHQKPWTIDQEYPVIAHPFEKEAKEAVSDEMKFNNALDTIDRISAYKGWGKNTPERAMLENAVLNIDNDGDAIWQFESNLERMGFDASTRSELVRAFALGLHNLEDPEIKKASNLIAQQKIANENYLEQLKLQRDYDKMKYEGDLKERELDIKQAEAESKAELNKYKGSYYMSKAMEGGATGKDKDGFDIPLDEEGNPIPQISPSDAKIEAKRYITSGNRILQSGSPEEVAQWLADVNYLRKQIARAYVKDNKAIPLDDVTDKMSGKVSEVGLDSVQELMEAKALEQVKTALERQAVLDRSSDVSKELVEANYALEDTPTENIRDVENAKTALWNKVGAVRRDLEKEENQPSLAEKRFLVAPSPGGDRAMSKNFGENSLKGNTIRAKILSKALEDVEKFIPAFSQKWKIAPSRERVWEEFKDIVDRTLSDAEKEVVRFGIEERENRAILEAYLKSKNLM